MRQCTWELDSLPEAIGERARVHAAAQNGDGRHTMHRRIEARGDFVLYWMHSALRVDENPALACAAHCANQLNLPLLVYQGLSERYKFAADRHHTFILQGARDVQRALAELGIAYCLHVETTEGMQPATIPCLRQLGQRAAVVITEDMPVAPMRQWTLALQRSIPVPVVLVDTACVLPMQLVGQAFDRAFAFRSATDQARQRRLLASAIALPSLSIDSSQLPADLTRPCIDLQKHSIAELVSQCKIDHTVGPVPGTRGGMEAGYSRWNSFKQNGLSAYARTRNDAARDGTSRMSAYLHYGMVSPQRIAREDAQAAQRGDVGAEKYLDELLVWRELAYTFCFYRPDHARLSALPKWAVETLGDHAADRRPAIHSWEILARGLTEDGLWNAAQHSLLIHGELHNNVRMTWGKAILDWTNDPRSALAMLIDLNHRYALDGRDPASYGGILWCLGQFDRPFSPVQPICGTVRPRPTAEHLRRLDLDTYRRHVSRPVYRMPTRIAVVGAGMSGLACARALTDHGLDVVVFDKSPRVGGRMASRSAPDSPVTTFDHGAQYFTARDERFQRLVCSWRESGIVAAWESRIVKLTSTGIVGSRGTTTRYVGIPCMRGVAEHLAGQIPLRLGTRVQRLLRSQAGAWNVECESGEVVGDFDYVVLALPAPQALALLGEHQSTNVSDLGLTRISDRLAQINWQPSWAVMLTLGAPSQIPFDAAFVHDSSLSWIARNSSKPERPSSPEAWLLHSTPSWASSWASENPLHQELEPHQRLAAHRSIQLQLVDELARVVKQAGIVGVKLEPQAIDSHFWRYAIPENPLSQSAWFDPLEQLAVCGDWCGGPRVEGAFLSGSAAAGHLLGHLSDTHPVAAWDDRKPRQLSLFE